MARWNGWAGTILDVDLNTGKIEKVPLDRDRAIKHLGGLGFGTRILFDEVGPEVDPLSPDSVISIGNGPLVGTMSPASGRIDVVAKSPLTGIFARSNSGGFWGSELKWAGYDSVVFRGESEIPVYLWIKDDHVELRDASHLWGKDTWETERILRKELGDHNIKTLCIGPAGENKSFAAAIINDLARGAATRGLGAILGAKKMKAVAVHGGKGVSIARPKELIGLAQELSERFKLDPMYYSHTKYGTNIWVGDIVMISIGKAMGQPPPKGLMSDAFYELYQKNLSCSGCPLHCSHFYNIKSGKYAGTIGEGVEGNTQLMGLELQVFDAAFVCEFNNLCNRLGLDVMHAGGIIGWAMRLYELGIIGKDDTDGIELTPGNEEAVLQMMHKVASNEGFGRILGLGHYRAAKEIGGGADAYISHVKKYPAAGAGFMSSVKTTIAHAVATRGHDHLTGSPGIETANRQREMTNEVLEKLGRERYNDPAFFTDIPWTYNPKYAKRVYDVENLFAISDMVGTCKFAAQEVLLVEGIGMEDYSRLLNAVTGEDFTRADLVKVAEREMALERSYNAREGIRKIDDYPHAFQWELEHGECHPRYDRSRYRMSLEDYKLLLDEYYRLRGCDIESGIPTRPTLEGLGLEDVADDLAKRGILNLG